MPKRQRSIEVRLHLRHVGLGNAILLELPDNRCGVVDWGTTDPTHHQLLTATEIRVIPVAFASGHQVTI